MSELQLYMLIAGGAAVVLAVAGVVWWLNQRPAVPIVKKGVLHELLLAAPIRLWALILAGPPLTAFAAWLVWIVRYGWDPRHAQQQLTILGYALFGAVFLLGIIVVALAAVRLEAETRLGKFAIGSDDDDDDDSPRRPPADDAGELPRRDRVG